MGGRIEDAVAGRVVGRGRERWWIEMGRRKEVVLCDEVVDEARSYSERGGNLKGGCGLGGCVGEGKLVVVMNWGRGKRWGNREK